MKYLIIIFLFSNITIAAEVAIDKQIEIVKEFGNWLDMYKEKCGKVERLDLVSLSCGKYEPENKLEKVEISTIKLFGDWLSSCENIDADETDKKRIESCIGVNHLFK